MWMKGYHENMSKMHLPDGLNAYGRNLESAKANTTTKEAPTPALPLLYSLLRLLLRQK